MESLEDRRLLATLHWQGDVDDNWGTSGNWATDIAGTATTAVPTVNDTLIFDDGTGGF